MQGAEGGEGEILNERNAKGIGKALSAQWGSDYSLLVIGMSFVRSAEN